jgi:acyl dehydratase
LSDRTTLWFEDLKTGTTTVSPARTVTEADVVAFAGLSGDYNPMHTDAETAAQGAFGTRVAHGLLGLSIASGLFTRTALSAAMQGSLVAMLGVEWRFRTMITIRPRSSTEAAPPAPRSTRSDRRSVR